MFFARKSIATIIQADHATRERAVKRRHKSDVFQSRLRASLVKTLPVEKRIPFEQAILTFPPGALPGSEEVVKQGLELAEGVEVGKKDEDKIYLLGDQREHAPEFLDSPLFRLALSRRVIATVADYLGFIPILATADFWFSPNARHVDETRGPGTRLFHMDIADPKLIKVFVHCTDVTADNGAIVAYDPRESSAIRSAMNYRYQKGENKSTDLTRPNGQFVQDRFVENCRPKGSPKALSGPAGTVNLVDTARCFHHGGRNQRTGVTRLLGMLLYLRPGALKLADKHKDTPPFAYLAPHARDDIERLVLGAEVKV